MTSASPLVSSFPQCSSVLSNLSSNHSFDWQHQSPPLTDLTKRLSQLNANASYHRFNVLDLAPCIHQSIYHYFQKLVIKQNTLLSYKVIDMELDQVNHDAQRMGKDTVFDEIVTFENITKTIKRWANTQNNFHLQVILAWNIFQYLNESQIKAIITIIQPYVNQDTLLYMIDCPYLLTSDQPANVTFSISYDKKNGSDESNLKKDKDKLSDVIYLNATHQSLKSTQKLPLTSYSLGCLANILEGFQPVKVNTLHSSNLSECLAKYTG